MTVPLALALRNEVLRPSILVLVRPHRPHRECASKVSIFDFSCSIDPCRFDRGSSALTARLHLSRIHIDDHQSTHTLRPPPLHLSLASTPTTTCTHAWWPVLPAFLHPPSLHLSRVDVHHSTNARSAATETNDNGHCPSTTTSTTSLRSTTAARTHSDGKYHHPHCFPES